ncbi:MAG: hypothetical protein O3C57_08020, partial [Verrucomicrobia bacterium]|nr:hypothetical protein [Verrucomicrobiota bacterium]
ARHLESAWDDIYNGEINTWDGQWLFACRRKGLISIAPNGNLVSNLGCRGDATHTRLAKHPFAELPFRPVQFPLSVPDTFQTDDQADFERARTEFLPGPADRTRRLLAKMTNKHLYGARIRKLPGIGKCWADWRDAP